MCLTAHLLLRLVSSHSGAKPPRNHIVTSARDAHYVTMYHHSKSRTNRHDLCIHHNVISTNVLRIRPLVGQMADTHFAKKTHNV